MYRDAPPPSPLVVARDGKITARDRNNGNVVWSVRLGDVDTKISCDGQMRCIVQGDHVIVFGKVGAPGWMDPPAHPRTLACLHLKDGKLLWRLDLEETRSHLGALYGTVLLDGDTLFLDDSGETYAVDVTSGHVRWRHDTGSSATAAALAVDGKHAPSNVR
jgi:outer membrane protein assembly factor BamB